MNAHITLEAYEFTAPDKWQLQRNSRACMTCRSPARTA
jgi:hypothetical protein